MKKLVAAGLATALLFSLVACTTKNSTPIGTDINIPSDIQQPSNTPTPTVKIDESFSRVATLFDNSIGDNYSDNIMLSPLSIDYALAMLTAASNGDTQKELLEYLNEDSVESLLDSYQNFLNELDNSVEIANSIWYKDSDDIVLNKTYKSQMGKYLDAKISPVDFSQKTVNEVNAWVNDKTHSMIPSIVEKFSPNTVMALINALYFENKWENQFEPGFTRDSVFHLFNGADITVPIMSGHAEEYLSNDNAVGFIKYYENQKYAFVGILPNDENMLSLSDVDIDSLMASKNREKVNITMPRFTFDYSTNLNKTIANMGVQQIFTDNADFSNGIYADGQTVSVTDILHKTKIELTESGTKAAAVTAIMMETTGVSLDKPKSVNLDRPFMFMIIDVNTNRPLFVGNVSNPVE